MLSGKKAVTEEHVENYHICAEKKKRKSGTHCTYTEVCIGKGSMNTQDKETGQIINTENFCSIPWTSFFSF